MNQPPFLSSIHSLIQISVHKWLVYQSVTSNCVIPSIILAPHYYLVFTALWIGIDCTYFRLDCGTGPGLVRSSHRVALGSWNHLSVFRHDWAVWLQLNNGHKEEGRSQVSRERTRLEVDMVTGQALCMVLGHH